MVVVEGGEPTAGFYECAFVHRRLSAQLDPYRFHRSDPHLRVGSGASLMPLHPPERAARPAIFYVTDRHRVPGHSIRICGLLRAFKGMSQSVRRRPPPSGSRTLPFLPTRRISTSGQPGNSNSLGFQWFTLWLPKSGRGEKAGSRRCGASSTSCYAFFRSKRRFSGNIVCPLPTLAIPWRPACDQPCLARRFSGNTTLHWIVH